MLLQLDDQRMMLLSKEGVGIRTVSSASYPKPPARMLSPQSKEKALKEGLYTTSAVAMSQFMLGDGPKVLAEAAEVAEGDEETNAGKLSLILDDEEDDIVTDRGFGSDDLGDEEDDIDEIENCDDDDLDVDVGDDEDTPNDDDDVMDADLEAEEMETAQTPETEDECGLDEIDEIDTDPDADVLAELENQDIDVDIEDLELETNGASFIGRQSVN